ncbi:MAG TPA: hypothetical protein DCW47_08550 [Lachnospiraceae bacterium]|nr:hypothetical protein [Lachnospiraceae bacterium]
MKNLFKKIALLTGITLILTESISVGPICAATVSNVLTATENEARWVYMTCLKDIYGARAEQTRIARQLLGSVKTLAQYNPQYVKEIPAAEERLKNAIAAEESAKKDMENGTLSSQSISQKFPYVYLTPGLSPQAVSVTIPAKQAVRVVINGIEAFSVLSTGRPVDPGSMLGLVSFIEPYARYEKWHITAKFYGQQKLVDQIELSGEVKDPKNFKRLDDFIQIWRPGVEAATFHVFLADNHSILAAWNLDGSVTLTDFNNHPQKPSDYKNAVNAAGSKPAGSASSSSTTTTDSTAGSSTAATSSSTTNSTSASASSSTDTSVSSSSSSSSTDTSSSSSSSSSSTDTSSSSSSTTNSSSSSDTSTSVNSSSASDSTIVSSNTVTAAVGGSNGRTIELSSDTNVWKTETGTRFHKTNDCGNMNSETAARITVRDAVAQGLEACEKCYN